MKKKTFLWKVYNDNISCQKYYYYYYYYQARNLEDLQLSVNKLQVFVNGKCLKSILGIRWPEKITNAWELTVERETKSLAIN